MHVTHPVTIDDKYSSSTGWGNDTLDPVVGSYSASSKLNKFLPSELRQPSFGNITTRLSYMQRLVEDLSVIDDEIRYRLWLELHSYPADERYGVLNITGQKVLDLILDNEDGKKEKDRLMSTHNHKTPPLPS